MLWRMRRLPPTRPSCRTPQEQMPLSHLPQLPSMPSSRGTSGITGHGQVLRWMSSGPGLAAGAASAVATASAVVVCGVVSSSIAPLLRLHVGKSRRARPAARLARLTQPLYLASMKRVFDMDDRARLPWRFYGATLTVLARL